MVIYKIIIIKKLLLLLNELKKNLLESLVEIYCLAKAVR